MVIGRERQENERKGWSKRAWNKAQGREMLRLGEKNFSEETPVEGANPNEDMTCQNR